MVDNTANKKRAQCKPWPSIKPLQETQTHIENWFRSPLGEQLLAAEQQHLNQIMPKIYGYHLMRLSVLSQLSAHQTLSQQSPVTHHFSLGVTASDTVGAVASFEQLPIDTECIDGVILHHVLEYSSDPHQLLREAARTVIANGYLVIIGFNPLSLLGIRKQIGQWLSADNHWCYHHLRAGRLIDWLRVLGFEPASIHYGYHGLPFNRGICQSVNQMCGKLLPMAGAFYIITARKGVIPMTLIKAPWKNNSSLRHWAKGSVVSKGTVSNRTYSTTEEAIIHEKS